MNPRFQRGFTLIEVMIVVAIIGILVALAYPSYKESVLKGKRTEGRTALLELMQQQERYMTQNNVYYAFSNSAGTTSPASPPFKTYSGDNAAKAAYYLSAAACTSSAISECVTISAAPIQADTDAGTLTLSSTGVKSCSGNKPSVCW